MGTDFDQFDHEDMRPNPPSHGDHDERGDVVARLERLEQRLSALEAMLGPPPSPDPTPPPPPPPAPADRVPAWSPPAPPRRLDAETVLKWTGVGLVTLAALFLVSTAIARGWIGPRLQLALAAAGGAALIAIALRLPSQRRPWSVALAHGGLVVLGICAGAAHAWLDLVPVSVSVALVAGVVGLATALAERLDHANLMANGLVLGLTVPGVITAYDALGPTFTAPWFVTLVAVTATVAWLRDWWTPRLIGLLTVGPLLVWVADDASGAETTVRLVVQLSIVTATVLWWPAPWLRPVSGSWRWLDVRSIMALPGLVWLTSSILWFPTELAEVELSPSGGWDPAAGPAAIAGLVAFGFAAPAAVGRSGMVRPMPRSLLFGHVIGISTVITIGLALLIDGPALLLSLTVQTLGLSLLAMRGRDLWLWANAAVLAVVVGTWAAAGIVTGIDVGLPWPEAVAYLIVVAVAGAIALVSRTVSREVAYSTAAAAWIGLLLWIVAVIKPLPQGQMVVSLLWAALGLGVVVLGAGFTAPSFTLTPEDSTALRRLGLATLAATVVKLVTVDLAEVDTIWRALLFAVVGAGLLRLGFQLGSDRAVPDDRAPL